MVIFSADQSDDELRFADGFYNYKIDLTEGRLYFHPFDTEYVVAYDKFIVINRINLTCFYRVNFDVCLHSVISDGVLKIFVSQNPMTEIIHFNLCE